VNQSKHFGLYMMYHIYMLGWKLFRLVVVDDDDDDDNEDDDDDDDG